MQPPFLAYKQPNGRSAKVNARDDSGGNGVGNQSDGLWSGWNSKKIVFIIHVCEIMELSQTMILIFYVY